MLSGIGPAGHLREVGIDVLVDAPGVGENLQDHPEGLVQWEALQPMPTASTSQILGNNECFEPYTRSVVPVGDVDSC